MDLNKIFHPKHIEREKLCSNKNLSIKSVIAAGIFAIFCLGTPTIAKSQEIQTKKTMDELCECYYKTKNTKIIVENKINLPTEILNHDTLMATNIFNLSKIYGEKYVDTINKHMLIELNKFREENGKLPLQLDPKLQKLSQDFADYLFNTNKEHPDHGTGEQNLYVRLLNTGINCDNIGYGENLCAGIEIPQESLCKLIRSEKHRILFLADDVVYFGLGLAITNVKDANDVHNDGVSKGTKTYKESKEKLYSIRIFTLTGDYEKNGYNEEL